MATFISSGTANPFMILVMEQDEYTSDILKCMDVGRPFMDSESRTCENLEDTYQLYVLFGRIKLSRFLSHIPILKMYSTQLLLLEMASIRFKFFFKNLGVTYT